MRTPPFSIGLAVLASRHESGRDRPFHRCLEADLAAAFLASHGVEVDVTERFQTTIDPLMQRALGLRLMGRADQAVQARDLLARARTGEFASGDADDLETATPGVRGTGRGLALAMALTGGFPGTSLPRRFRAVHGVGAVLVGAVLLATILLFVAGR